MLVDLVVGGHDEGRKRRLADMTGDESAVCLLCYGLYVVLLL